MADVIVEKERTSNPIVAVVTIVVLLLLGYLAWQYFAGMNTTDTTNETTDVNITAPAEDTQTPATNETDTQTQTQEQTPTTEEPTPDTTQ
ncbi:MAG: hypothetical protein ABIQ64_03680 [Candidatus Saccharimonadales bacterium]